MLGMKLACMLLLADNNCPFSLMVLPAYSTQLSRKLLLKVVIVSELYHTLII